MSIICKRKNSLKGSKLSSQKYKNQFNHCKNTHKIIHIEKYNKNHKIKAAQLIYSNKIMRRA